MGRVLVLVRVLPDDVSVQPEDLVKRIEKELPSKYQLIKYQGEPIAFGLQALRMIVVMPEEQAGGTSELEEVISSVDGVSQVDVLSVSRVLE